MEYEVILICEKQFADSLIACLTTLPCLVEHMVEPGPGVLFILKQSMFWWHGKFMNICVCITGIETFAITYILIMFSGELYYQGESFAFVNWCCVQLCSCGPWSSRFSWVIFQITLSLLALPEHKHRQSFI